MAAVRNGRLLPGGRVQIQECLLLGVKGILLARFTPRPIFLPDVDDQIEADEDVMDQHEADVGSINEMMMIF